MNYAYGRRAGIWSVGALIIVLLLALVAGVARASLDEGGGGTSTVLASDAAPTIESDLPDYPPGATVTLTGANWQGDSTVLIQVNDDLGSTWFRNQEVPVAADGTIVDVFDLPDWFVATYSVLAIGQDTGRTATTSFTDAVPISNDFNQAQNGNPHDGNANWIGSVLNETKTTYKEGMTAPQRLVIANGPAAAATDAQGYQYWTFGVAFQHNGKYAYDFPTGSSPAKDKLWGQAEADGAFKGLPWSSFNHLANLQNTYLTPAKYLLPAQYGGDGNGTLAQPAFPDTIVGMPAPEATKLAGIIAAYEAKYGDRRLDIFHDGNLLEQPTITAALQGSLNYSSSGGTIYVNYTVKMKPDPTSKPNRLYIGWGGHIAVGYDGSAKFGGIDDDWGLGMGAGAISGAPYHIKMAGWAPDGNIGSQDNQIMASAVIAPGLKSGYKFDDRNGNGVWDKAAEPPIAGWTIRATNGSTVNMSTTTGADGYYEFVLDPGTYTVYEDTQTGWNQTRPFAGMGGLPSGYSIVTAPNGTLGYRFTMAEAADHPNNDFGNRRNQGEIIVKKVIFPPGYPDAIAKTDFPFGVTGPSGPWSFKLDLYDSDDAWFDTWKSGKIDIGTYIVTETVPQGWTLLNIESSDPETTIDKPNAKATLKLDPDETITVTYTNEPPGGGLPVKRGMKFEDLNADGKKDAGEPGLQGWTIYVDYNDNGQLDAGEPSGVTGADGKYTIGGIKVGTWKVREVAQAGWNQSYPAGGYYEEEFTYYSVYEHNDFGNWKPATKSGMKFEDLNANGIKDALESDAGLSGWTIYVDYNDNGQLDAGEPSAVTAADGTYTITGIKPGTYKVREVLKPGWTVSYPALGYYAETFKSSDVKTGNDFGNWYPATKSGYKWHDLNADGVWDDGEPALKDWTIQAWQNGAKVAEATTGADGQYQLSLKPGSYTIKEDLKAGWNQSYPYGDGVWNVTLKSREIDTGNNFGNYQNATKSGMKFEDLNADGKKDAGEPGIAGWTIEASMGGQLVAFTTTDQDGKYSFTVKPGTYTFSEKQEAGWTQSYPAAPGTYTETLKSGDESKNNDFGNHRQATKSGYKWHDLNADGVWDAGEPGLSGWTIRLKGTDGMGNPVDLSTTTDADGKYSFTVTPGTYTVSEDLQIGWKQSFPAGDGTWKITLTSGETDNNNNFGNYKNATKSGMKFEDLNADGKKDAGEPGLEGWKIEAVQNGSVVADTTTGADGKYSFSLKPGTYTFREVQKSGWTQSYPAAPGTYTETLKSGEESKTNDFGNWRPAKKSGAKWHDVNGNGSWDAGEPGLSGWTIEAVQNDQVVASTTTGADGKYSFSLKPGTYTFREVQQTGWEQTYPAAPGTYTETLKSGEESKNNDFGNWKPYKTKTPGYWKNHTDKWSGTEAPAWNGGYYTPDRKLGTVFTIPAGYSTGGKRVVDFQTATLLQALNFQGGSTLNGKAQILFRAAVAALLNSTHPMTSYPYTDKQIVEKVNQALIDALGPPQDASKLTDLAAEFDWLNNFYDF
jgi:protocatechuate 3,4-dioxygenase beta subunit